MIANINRIPAFNIYKMHRKTVYKPTLYNNIIIQIVDYVKYNKKQRVW